MMFQNETITMQRMEIYIIRSKGEISFKCFYVTNKNGNNRLKISYVMLKVYMHPLIKTCIIVIKHVFSIISSICYLNLFKYAI